MRERALLPLVLALAACLFSCGCPKRQRPAVVLLGIDGADWQLIDRLIAKGRLPLFARLKQEAAWGHLRTITPAKSPVVWTSIASGKTKGKHGVEDFRSRRMNRRGKHPIANSLDIREPLLWEMLGSQGRRSILVNWYLSYPPQPLNGLNVSDYFAVSAFSSSPSRAEQLRQAVFPPARAAELVKGIDADYPRVLKGMGLPDYPSLYDRRGTGMRYSDFPIFSKFPELVLQEGAVVGTAAALFPSEPFDLFAAYYELTDVVQHFAFLSFVDETFKRELAAAAVDGRLPARLEDEAYSRIAEVVCPVYQNVERILQAYFDAAGDRELYFIILSDHGFSFFVRDGTVRYNHIGQARAPDGILIVRGPGVRRGKIRLARIYDIAPTVLHILGLPQDHSMDGEPLRRLFAFKRPNRFTVYTKGKNLAGGADSEAEEKKLQELKALGYIN